MSECSTCHAPLEEDEGVAVYIWWLRGIYEYCDDCFKKISSLNDSLHKESNIKDGQ